MKKTIALILAIIMMAALAVPAFAETETTPAAKGVTTEIVENPSNNNCKVTYGVGKVYTVSLPTTVNFAFTKDPQTATVAVTSLVIDGSEKLVVTVDSTNETDPVGGWNMVCVGGQGSAPVPYTITKSAPTTPINGAHVPSIATGPVVNAKVDGETAATTILEVNSNVGGTGGAVVLTFETNGTSQAGDYSDTITFGVSIAAK